MHLLMDAWTPIWGADVPARGCMEIIMETQLHLLMDAWRLLGTGLRDPWVWGADAVDAWRPLGTRYGYMQWMHGDPWVWGADVVMETSVSVWPGADVVDPGYGVQMQWRHGYGVWMQYGQLQMWCMETPRYGVSQIYIGSFVDANNK